MSKTSGDPTGMARIRRNGVRLISSRLKESEKQIKALFRTIQSKRLKKKKIATNQGETIYYDYDYSPEDERDTEILIASILSLQLLGTTNGSIPPTDWYYRNIIEQPYRQGVIEEVRNGNQSVRLANRLGMLANGMEPVEVDDLRMLFSSSYTQELNRAISNGFTSITGISNTTQTQVTGVINRGIASRAPPADIIRDITGRFEVAQSSAKRTVETSVNAVYNNAKMETVRRMQEITGLNSGVVHLSAFLPTTRPHHAARHGNTYTVEDQLNWWSQDANRINCHCSTRSILLDDAGKVVDEDLLIKIGEKATRFY